MTITAKDLALELVRRAEEGGSSWITDREAAAIVEKLRNDIGRLRAALTGAQMAMEQGLSLDARVAANSPTVRQVISGALAATE